MKQAVTLKFFQGLAILAIIAPLLVHAATTSFDITATSSSFSPATVTVNKGDAVTLNFSVPASDDYCCGLEVRSSKFSTVAVSRGGSGSATFTADSSFTFSSYWPASNVHKADGSLVIQAAAEPSKTVTAPTIAKVQPGRFKRKTSGTFTITITGTNFNPGATVKVAGVKAQKVTRHSATKLTAVIPRKNLASGKRSVTVINKDGGKVTKKKAVTIVP